MNDSHSSRLCSKHILTHSLTHLTGTPDGISVSAGDEEEGEEGEEEEEEDSRASYEIDSKGRPGDFPDID
jgi:hypothetical protein